MSKYAPGPWAVESTEYSSSSSPQYEVYSEAGDCVAVCDSEDDALLAAAAPDLLAACEEFLSGSARAPLLARFALAKAKGEKT